MVNFEDHSPVKGPGDGTMLLRTNNASLAVQEKKEVE